MEYQPRAARRHIPRSFQGWDDELRGLIKFIVDQHKFESEYGNAWYARLCKYNCERIEVLLRNQPRLPPDYAFPDLSELPHLQMDLFRDRPKVK